MRIQVFVKDLPEVVPGQGVLLGLDNFLHDLWAAGKGLTDACRGGGLSDIGQLDVRRIFCRDEALDGIGCSEDKLVINQVVEHFFSEFPGDIQFAAEHFERDGSLIGLEAAAISLTMLMTVRSLAMKFSSVFLAAAISAASRLFKCWVVNVNCRPNSTVSQVI